MSNDMFDETELDNILGDGGQEPAAEPKLSPQQKAAATRKRNLAVKKLAAEQATAEADAEELSMVQAGEIPAPVKQAGISPAFVPPVVPEAPKQNIGKGGKIHKFAKGEMRWITVQKGRDKGEDRPVPVNVQGKQFTVPRGIRVEVPAMVAEVLKNAEESVVEWDGENTISARPAASYPTSIHGE